jgi:hypothetical protein
VRRQYWQSTRAMCHRLVAWRVSRLARGGFVAGPVRNRI